MNPLLLTDFYKIGHPFQYPAGTRFVYSNLTPRKSRIAGVDHMVFFGLQYFAMEYLVTRFNRDFFQRPLDEVMAEYKRVVQHTIGGISSYQHIEDLHKLGYLPIKIKAVKEGTRVPMRVPVLTIINTDERFYWLTNFIESLMSAIIWQPCTSATIAYEYRKLLDEQAWRSGMPESFVQWQGHDFSFRGMSSLESAITSGMGHLLSFTGTDTVPAILAMEKYYGADVEKELVGGSIPATEHSVMCSGAKDCELDTIKRLITAVYPSGMVSIVSDTWDLWKVLTEYLPTLKTEIMNRNGKVVIRPDSGDPVLIICGDLNGTTDAQRKGVVELLWDCFGGTVTATGHKLLCDKVGAIYGDSITITRAKEIGERLMSKGFASQVVFGIGSYTYQYNTRDTFGTAMKATAVVIGEELRPIWKDPVTDDGTKVSAKGLLRVDYDRKTGTLKLTDQVSWVQEAQGELQTVFLDGKIAGPYTTLREIRQRLHD